MEFELDFRSIPAPKTRDMVLRHSQVNRRTLTLERTSFVVGGRKAVPIIKLLEALLLLVVEGAVHCVSRAIHR